MCENPRKTFGNFLLVLLKPKVMRITMIWHYLFILWLPFRMITPPVIIIIAQTIIWADQSPGKRGEDELRLSGFKAARDEGVAFPWYHENGRWSLKNEWKQEHIIVLTLWWLWLSSSLQEHALWVFMLYWKFNGVVCFKLNQLHDYAHPTINSQSVGNVIAETC